MKLSINETFIAVGKKQIGEHDFSFIDEFGCPHFFEYCELSGHHKTDTYLTFEEFKTHSCN